MRFLSLLCDYYVYYVIIKLIIKMIIEVKYYWLKLLRVRYLI